MTLFHPKSCESISNKFRNVENGVFTLFKDDNKNFGEKVFCYFETEAKKGSKLNTIL